MGFIYSTLCAAQTDSWPRLQGTPKGISPISA